MEDETKQTVITPDDFKKELLEDSPKTSKRYKVTGDLVIEETRLLSRLLIKNVEIEGDLILNNIHPSLLSIYNTHIKGELCIKESIFSNGIDLSVITAEKGLLLEKSKFTNFLCDRVTMNDQMIVNHSVWECATVDDYRIARLLELSKSGVFIPLSEIPY